MDYHFKPCDRNQMLLLPPSLDEWLPESHLSRFIVDAVGPFDLAEFMAQYRSDGTGQAAFHPAPVLALLLYWYCKGERSSRKIESYCEDDVASRFIMAHLKPDHSMFCRFRARHQSAIAKLFVQVLQLCEKAGLVKLGSVSLDGTKIKASAALDANRKRRGRKPKLPDEVVDKDQKANATDPHSRIMKTRSGYVQGYNAQAVVSEEQIVLAADVTPEENDQKQLKPMLRQAKENLLAIGMVAALGAVLVDAGYCSDENLKAEEEFGVDLYCATTKDWKQRKALSEAFAPRGRMPQH